VSRFTRPLPSGIRHLDELEEPPAARSRCALGVLGDDGDRQRLRHRPERAVLGEWGGRAVTVPYLAGRSTSNLIERTTTRER
jgi:hypothetical protein